MQTELNDNYTNLEIKRKQNCGYSPASSFMGLLEVPAQKIVQRDVTVETHGTGDGGTDAPAEAGTVVQNIPTVHDFPSFQMIIL